nr:immunoglobulin light chain junction region [Macaca mulatta]MOY05206.1 immunoglobulin light chain junction region [Macaca mulatta]MOY05302.1 immunoglobulin light chain junction region [Macaca mulatta]MOY05589.1 immunoglobulin light chain junction region [Macaca mulatta]MOY06275.1 immunoglobulin light chain junction region [Macaca mulatta]
DYYCQSYDSSLSPVF